jgi:MFS family permease
MLMRSSSLRAQVGILIFATSIIQLANGFFGTFISLRVAIEDFGPTISGLVLSSYFAGFTLGALRCEGIIERVGHIRAYAAFAGMVVAATATMPLLAGALPWLILRAVIGFGCSGLFIATESWLNAKVEPSERGRIFSFYMFGTFLALALGQLLIGKARVEAADPFNAIAVLFAVALVIVSTTRAEPPRSTASSSLPFGQLFRAAPVAVVGCMVSGLVSASFYALVPAWMQDEGIARETIATFMLFAVLGGLAFQIPIGRVSDQFDRRVVLSMLSFGFCRNRDCAGHLAALSPGDLVRRGAARRLHVDAVPGLCRQRTRSNAGRSGGRSERPAHLGQRAGFDPRPADRHECHGAFGHQRCVLFHGCRRPAPGSPGHGPVRGDSAAAAPGANLRAPGAAGNAACPRFAWVSNAHPGFTKTRIEPAARRYRAVTFENSAPSASAIVGCAIIASRKPV